MNTKAESPKTLPPADPQTGFLGIYTALYPSPQTWKTELNFRQGDLLCVLEKRETGWWKAKKRTKPGERSPVGWVSGSFLMVVSVDFASSGMLS